MGAQVAAGPCASPRPAPAGNGPGPNRPTPRKAPLAAGGCGRSPRAPNPCRKLGGPKLGSDGGSTRARPCALKPNEVSGTRGTSAGTSAALDTHTLPVCDEARSAEPSAARSTSKEPWRARLSPAGAVAGPEELEAANAPGADQPNDWKSFVDSQEKKTRQLIHLTETCGPPGSAIGPLGLKNRLAGPSAEEEHSGWQLEVAKQEQRTIAELHSACVEENQSPRGWPTLRSPRGARAATAVSGPSALPAHERAAPKVAPAASTAADELALTATPGCELTVLKAALDAPTGEFPAVCSAMQELAAPKEVLVSEQKFDGMRLTPIDDRPFQALNSITRHVTAELMERLKMAPPAK